MTYNNALDGYIADIIQNYEIKEQKDLQNILKKRGCDIPQATLSRHLKKLKIIKIGGIYKMLDISPHNLPLILNLQISDLGMIVIHTHPGQASSLASFIDRKHVSFTYNKSSSSDILGTIAGDDTVLLIIKNNTVIKDVLTAIYQDFPYLQKGKD